MAWVHLLRLALFPSILWDFVAGMVLAGLASQLFVPERSVPPLLALIALYHGGMVLNDWADRKDDSIYRSSRPLASGAVRPSVALFIAAALLFGGAYLAGFEQKHVQILLGVILVYNLGSRYLRHWLGPVLLAIARAIALSFGPLFWFEPSAFVGLVTLLPAACYALYFLFLSRLAQAEERGLPGMSGLGFSVACAVTPLALLQIGTPHWALAPFWLALIAFIVRPAWVDRGAHWSPTRVQMQVRRLLSAAPLLLSVILAAKGEWAWALGGPIASLSVNQLAKLTTAE